MKVRSAVLRSEARRRARHVRLPAVVEVGQVCPLHKVRKRRHAVLFVVNVLARLLPRLTRLAMRHGVGVGKHVDALFAGLAADVLRLGASRYAATGPHAPDGREPRVDHMPGLGLALVERGGCRLGAGAGVDGRVGRVEGVGDGEVMVEAALRLSQRWL